MLKLLKIQLLSLFGLNKALHTKDPKAKRKLMGMFILFIFVFLYLFIMSYGYSYGMSMSLAPMGLAHLQLGMMMAISSLVTFIFTVYKTEGVLYGFKDFDLIMSMPVSTTTVVSSRIAMLYLSNAFLIFVIMIPSGIVYAQFGHPGILYYPFFALTLLLLPVIPSVLGALVSLLIKVVSAGSRHKNILSIVMTFVLVFAIIFFTQKLTSIDEAAIIDLATSFTGTVNRIYPLADLYINGVAYGRISDFILFIALNGLIFMVFCSILSNQFVRMNTHITTERSKRRYKLGTLQARSKLSAILSKEAHRYLSSSIYVMNTAFSAVALTIMSIGLLIFGNASLESLLGTPEVADMIRSLAPIAIGALLAFMNTTSASISLEGNSLWVMKSMPVSPLTIFAGKVALNLAIFVPSALINSAILTFILKPDPQIIPWMFVTPLIYVLFSSVMGLTVNLLMPNFDWKSLIIPVKQSSALIVSLLFSFAVMLLPIIVYLALGIDAWILTGGTTIILLFATMGMYMFLRTRGLRIWENL